MPPSYICAVDGAALAKLVLPPAKKLRWIFMFKTQNEKGVTIVEYAIMLALIAIAIAVAAPNITSAVVNVFSKASSVMN